MNKRTNEQYLTFWFHIYTIYKKVWGDVHEIYDEKATILLVQCTYSICGWVF